MSPLGGRPASLGLDSGEVEPRRWGREGVGARGGRDAPEGSLGWGLGGLSGAPYGGQEAAAACACADGGPAASGQRRGAGKLHGGARKVIAPPI